MACRYWCKDYGCCCALVKNRPYTLKGCKEMQNADADCWERARSGDVEEIKIDGVVKIASDISKKQQEDRDSQPQ